jgi:regulator of cell morphogenesis and NO signaling
MNITADTRVSDIAATNPGTIKIFQQHQIDFCCGGKIPLGEACARQGIDADTLLAELRAARRPPEGWPDWEKSTLTALITHIQQRYHEPLRGELPRLGAMLKKVVERHGDRLLETLLPLQFTFERLQRELLFHMSKEDTVLFPAIIAAEAATRDNREGAESWGWIEQPIDAMVTEHESAGSALAAMRALTHGYTPPEGACPTFRGLYHGLAELENDMHLHVHLENSVLFPRAASMVNVTN